MPGGMGQKGDGNSSGLVSRSRHHSKREGENKIADRRGEKWRGVVLLTVQM
jgi:hypothetical protein